MKICKFCGHPHNDEEVHRLKRPRPSVAQRAEDIIERRPPTYKILSYNLNEPRINELQNFSADSLSVIEAIPDDLQFTIKINYPESDEIPMKLGRTISIPFVRFFLTTPAQPSGKLKLMIGGELGDFKFEAPDIAQGVVVDPVISAVHRRDIFAATFEPSNVIGEWGLYWAVVEGGSRSLAIEKIVIKEHDDRRGIIFRILRCWISPTRPTPIESTFFRSFHFSPPEDKNLLLHFTRATQPIGLSPPVSEDRLSPNGLLTINFPVPVILDPPPNFVMGFGFAVEPVPAGEALVGGVPGHLKVGFYGYRF